jgi:outer membrane protein OmpA-like peptidoglycan-associated protein
MRRFIPIAFVATALLAGCSAAPAVHSAPPSPGPPASPSGDGLPNIDDYNDDGTPDPTCGTQDFGAGLVLVIPCDIGGHAHTPEDGTRLVKDSLYRLPGPDLDLAGVSGEMVAARDPAGKRVFILISNSDGLFDTGSDAINSTGNLDAMIRLVNTTFPNGVIQVRGHTDSTGSRSGNEALSRRRAERVRGYFADHRLKASGLTAVGLGSSRPLVEEKNADGSVSTAGRAFNRRVEVVIRIGGP